MTDTKTETFSALVLQDYENNFIPRKEIKLRLSFEQLKNFLSDKELLGWIKVTWPFRFYAKQLFWLSWNQMSQSENFTKDRVNMLKEAKDPMSMVKELEDIVKFDSSNEARALVAFIKVSFFLKDISRFELHEIFAGCFIYDDYCAQIAYEEFKKRGD